MQKKNFKWLPSSLSSMERKEVWNQIYSQLSDETKQTVAWE